MKYFKLFLTIVFFSLAAFLLYFSLQKLPLLSYNPIERSHLSQSLGYIIDSDDFVFEFDFTKSGQKTLYVTNKVLKTAPLNIDGADQSNIELLLKDFWIKLGTGENGMIYRPGPECHYVEFFIDIDEELLSSVDKKYNIVEVHRIDCLRALDLEFRDLS